MLTKLIFILYLWTGTVSPQHNVDGRTTYAIFLEDGSVVDYAYKGEVLHWIETEEFQYNEDYED